MKVTVRLSPSRRLTPLKPGIGRELVDLRADGSELRREARAGRGVGGLERLLGETLGGLDELRERLDPLVGRLDGLDREADLVLQARQVAGATVQALGGEVVDRIVDGGVDPFARRQPKLGLLGKRGSLLDGGKRGANAGREGDRHNKSPFWSWSLRTGPASAEPEATLNRAASNGG